MVHCMFPRYSDASRNIWTCGWKEWCASQVVCRSGAARSGQTDAQFFSSCWSVSPSEAMGTSLHFTFHSVRDAAELPDAEPEPLTLPLPLPLPLATAHATAAVAQHISIAAESTASAIAC